MHKYPKEEKPEKMEDTDLFPPYMNVTFKRKNITFRHQKFCGGKCTSILIC